MKKKILCLVITAGLLVSLSGCGTTYQEAARQTGNNADDTFCNGYFTKITEWADGYSNYYIAYANDTKVKYLIMSAKSRSGVTPLYNTDGTLQVYGGGND